jgi:hypothetical protein
LHKIQTQVSIDNSVVIHKTQKDNREFMEAKFGRILKEWANIYRSVGLRSGDERIDPTVSFVVLKYISEKEEEVSTLNNVIKLWDDFWKIVKEEENRDLSSEFNTTVDQIGGREPR